MFPLPFLTAEQFFLILIFIFGNERSLRSCRFYFANSDHGAGVRSSAAVAHRIDE
jgi:hypothetical protein